MDERIKDVFKNLMWMIIIHYENLSDKKSLEQIAVMIN